MRKPQSSFRYLALCTNVPTPGRHVRLNIQPMEGISNL
jgi:hypothetical protein